LFVIILNTVLYFTGIGGYLWTPTIRGEEIGMTIGSIIVLGFGIAFLGYYVYQVLRTAVTLAAEDEARLVRRLEKEAHKAEKSERKVEKKIRKKLEKEIAHASSTKKAQNS
jgi:hypothetical protein